MIQASTESISIKGFRDGLLVSLGSQPLEEALTALAADLEDKAGFLAGSQVTLTVGERVLDEWQLGQVQALLADHEMTLWTVLSEQDLTKQAARGLGLATRLPGSNVDLDGNALVDVGSADGPEASGADGQTAANGLVLRETVRSGRSIFHEGHVIVIGDVNAGAEVMAGGDVIVWGRLRGLVHAGALGDRSAVICALALNPTQLRIAEQIAISPAQSGRKSVPEKAHIQNDQIVAEAWDVRR
ncbi:MAG: septum site-determining protein MinC [Candidatus Promineifilaceae bacterium]|nr:septum site-determining protein MinC [Candidatus Promineifilaceae bacterium]